MKTLKQELDEQLFLLLGDKVFVNKWWNSPNFHFGLRTPAEVFKTDKKEVIKYIDRQFI